MKATKISSIIDSASGGGKAGVDKGDKNLSSLSGGEESGLLVSSQMLGKYGETTKVITRMSEFRKDKKRERAAA